MLRFFCLLILVPLSVLSNDAFAQSARKRLILIRGQVLDTFTDAAIPDVEISLLHGDSTLIERKKVDVGHFTTAYKVDAVYDFFIEETKTSDKNYIVKATHPQYTTVYLPFSTKKYGRKIDITLPDIFMQRTSSLRESTMQELTVRATKVKVYHKGDTLVYNADAFNVPDGSMLDALIRQMPGTELKSNGEIFVNGKKIDFLLLNGQDFFKGRNKLMLENLPYYTVEKIKVYDKRTERAETLHDATAPKNYVMDVNLKKEYRTGYMSHIEAGCGNEESYLARLFGLRYSDHARLTLIGNSNNTSLSGNMGYNEEFLNRFLSGDGVTTTHTGELDWLYNGKTFKNDLQIGYTNNMTESGQTAYNETFHGTDGSTYGFSKSESEHKVQSVGIENQFTKKVPFWVESKTILNYRDAKTAEMEQSGNASDNVWHERNVEFLDSLLQTGIPVNAYGVQNATLRHYVKSPWTLSAMQSLDLAKDLVTGDIVSLTLSLDFKKSDYDAVRREHYLFLQPNPYTRHKNEDITGGEQKTSFDAHLSYKLIELWHSDWTLFADYRYGKGKKSEHLYNVDTQMRDEQNSYDYRTHENFFTSGLAYNFIGGIGKEQNDLLVARLTLPVVVKNLNSKYHRSVLDTCIVQHHVHFEPSLNAECTHGKNKFELKSAYSYTLPDVTQLIDIPLTSDLLYRYIGNSSLKPSSDLSASISYNRTLKYGNYILNSISYVKSFNQIVNSYIYYPEDGTYLFRPVNTDGSWNITYDNSCWKYLHQSDKGSWVIKWDGTIGYGENVNYFATNDLSNQGRSTNRLLRVSVPLRFGFSHKDFGCGIDGRFAWNHAFNNISDVAYSDAMDYGGGLYLRKKLFWGISASTDFNVYLRCGYSGTDVNKPEYVWDFAFSKTILKEKLTFRLSAVDVLRNRSVLSYTVSSQGVSEIQKTKIPGYLLLTVSYRMLKNPKKK